MRAQQRLDSRARVICRVESDSEYRYAGTAQVGSGKMLPQKINFSGDVLFDFPKLDLGPATRLADCRMTSRDALIACLQPDRRVDVTVKGNK